MKLKNKNQIMNDIIGKKFGKLLVLNRTNIKSKTNGYYYECLCDCGNKVNVLKHNLTSFHTKSCGCLRKVCCSYIGKTNKQLINDMQEKDGYIILKIKDKECLIDKDVFNVVKNYKFCIQKGYAFNNKIGKLHKFIVGSIPKGMQVDHINGNRMDNRRCNLRVCSNQQNSFNRKCNGYYFRKDLNKWQSYITVNNKTITLGCYEKEEDAIRVRKEAEEKYFGDYRRKGEYV